LQKLRQAGGEPVVTLPPVTPSAAPAPFRAEARSVQTAPVAETQVSRASEMREEPAVPTRPVAAPELADLTGLWSNLLEAVGRASPFTRTYLLKAHPVSFNKNLFVVGFDPQFEDDLSLADNARNHTLLQTKLAEMGYAGAQLKFIKAEAPEGFKPPAAATEPSVPGPEPAGKAAPPVRGPARAATASPAATPGPAREKPAPMSFNKDEFKNDPLIQRALEIFKGQIVEVRA
jgi:hypothetical protein